MTWEGERQNVQKLLLDKLLPEAIQGLQMLEFSSYDIDYYLNQIIKSRAMTGWTGAAWQKSFIDLHGNDFALMTKEYIANQATQKPVMDWKV